MDTLLELQVNVFGSLFQLANQLQAAGDRYLAGDKLTTKQWFLIVAVGQFTDTEPTITETAELMGTSRQNVKQLALKLEKRGFMRIARDARDTRIYRLRLTNQCTAFWNGRQAQDAAFVARVFHGLTAQELQTVSRCFQLMLQTIQQGGIADA